MTQFQDMVLSWFIEGSHAFWCLPFAFFWLFESLRVAGPTVPPICAPLRWRVHRPSSLACKPCLTTWRCAWMRRRSTWCLFIRCPTDARICCCAAPASLLTAARMIVFMMWCNICMFYYSAPHPIFQCPVLGLKIFRSHKSTIAHWFGQKEFLFNSMEKKHRQKRQKTKKEKEWQEQNTRVDATIVCVRQTQITNRHSSSHQWSTIKRLLFKQTIW